MTITEKVCCAGKKHLGSCDSSCELECCLTFEQAWRSLHEELAEWPDWHLRDLTAGSSAGSRGPNGEFPPDPQQAWYRRTYEDSWCATAAKDGWAEREWNMEYSLYWGPTPAAAMQRLRDELNHRRTDPHYAHIVDHEFRPECADCVRDWREAGNETPLTRLESYA